MSSITIEPTPPTRLPHYAAAAPAVLKAMLNLQQAVTDTGLEPSMVELVKLRVSQINGCAFCIDMHFREAKAAGETEARLYLLDAWSETSLYTPRERAALRWAEVLTRLANGHVSDADRTAAREVLGEAELAELTLAIVAINGWNRLNVGFGVAPRLGA